MALPSQSCFPFSCSYSPGFPCLLLLVSLLSFTDIPPVHLCRSNPWCTLMSASWRTQTDDTALRMHTHPWLHSLDTVFVNWGNPLLFLISSLGAQGTFPSFLALTSVLFTACCAACGEGNNPGNWCFCFPSSSNSQRRMRVGLIRPLISSQSLVLSLFPLKNTVVH